MALSGEISVRCACRASCPMQLMSRRVQNRFPGSSLGCRATLYQAVPAATAHGSQKTLAGSMPLGTVRQSSLSVAGQQSSARGAVYNFR